MHDLTVITYHYVRNLSLSRYPNIKGLSTGEFREQISFLLKRYTFVSVQDCIDAVYHNDSGFPNNAVLLTFDDGYLDHFTDVFPILDEHEIQGCFFAPANPILNHRVLNENKIHYILSTTSNIESLIKEIYNILDLYRSEYNLETNEYYFRKLGLKTTFDTKEVMFIKRLLQYELENRLRTLIVEELFQKYVTKDEASFSKELYMDIDQIKCMIRNGMYFGSHGFDHCWLNRLPQEKQEEEIDLSLNFLSQIGASLENWVMSYPHGGYSIGLVETLKKKNCKLAFTIDEGLSELTQTNALTLKRIDAKTLHKFK